MGEDGKLRSVEQTVVRILWGFFFFPFGDIVTKND